MKIMEKMKDKVALITGGTSGMGLATAKELLSQGAKVIITGRNPVTVNETVAELGANALGIVSDAGRMADLLLLKEEVKLRTDHIDLLFVNAGYGRFAPVELVSESLFDELFGVLVKGTFFTVQQLLPLIPEGGSIVLNTSVVTRSGYPNFSVYSAAKSAVGSFIKTFAAECTAKRIRVNGISPGYIRTNGFKKTGLTDEQIEGVIGATIPTLPFRRFGEAAEIAKTAAFLLSDDASYIHGAEIVVDGGLSVIR
jgi:NAD(P)-dependent dehydrogenase (short-subunit alcohol dehydrogenase family)